MPSSSDFVDFILDQLNTDGCVSYRKMFGEYGIYYNGKIFGLICDNKLFIKPTVSGRKFIGHVVEAPPYPKAKPYFLIEDQLDDREWLRSLMRVTFEELPEPKHRKK